MRDRLVFWWNWLTGGKSYQDVEKKSEVPIYFLGVWDTVVAYGLPIDELTQAVDRWVWPMTFDDKNLLPNVRHARHALSLDDERKTFSPIPWNEAGHDRLLQVWFAGAHADVGGGYPDDGLSYVALCWMIGEAAKEGLRFEPSLVASYKAIAAPTGRIYDPRAGFGAFWRYQPRDVQQLVGVGNTPLVHSSAILRMVYGNDGYAPISLPEKIDLLPPNGTPVAFNRAAVAKAMADAVTGRCRSPSCPQRIEAEERRRFLTNMHELVPAASSLARTQLFALVKDTVWWRRVVYFLSLFLALLAGAFPPLQEYLRIDGVTTRINDVAGGTTNWAAGLVRGFLPSFASPWLDAIVYNPAAALLIGVGLIASLKFSGFLQYRIRDRARASWNVRRQVVHLRLTGQRHALAKGALGFGALAAAIAILSQDGDPRLIAFFATLTLLCLGYLVLRLRRRIPARKIDPADPGFLLGLARRLRGCQLAVASYQFTARILAPAAFLGATAVIVLSLAQRTSFDLLNAGGALCHSTIAMPDERLDAVAVIRTNSICNPTGLRLVAGRTYRIQLEMKDAWFDKDERSDVGGFAAANVVPPGESWFTINNIKHYLPYYAAAPLKRWWLENWFQPIARVGERGNYEHVLRPAAPLPVVFYSRCRPPEESALSGWAAIKDDILRPAEPEFRDKQLKCEASKGLHASRLLISDITANASGELFIYVNDAALALPWLTDLFYRNNSGTATVTVKRLLAPQVIDSE